ncbi:MAG: hypothetical protein WAM97_01675 [Acidimicrobiales bacterium]
MIPIALSGCSTTSPNSAPAKQGSAPKSAAYVLGADHDCIVAGSAHPTIDWSDLQNPILSTPDAGEKDQVMVWFGNRWHMIFSYVRNDPSVPGGVYWDIATSSSPDMVTWTQPDPWPAQSGALGVAGPQLVQNPQGDFVVTYQSDPGQRNGDQDRLYYRTTDDFVKWSAPHPLAQSLATAPGDRMIDGSLAWTANGLILGYKAGLEGSQQAFEIAWSPNGSLEGPWQYIGKPDIVVNGDTVERYEFLNIEGAWHLMATSNLLDQPWLFKLSGNPDKASGWLKWTGGYELAVPKAGWDSGAGISSVTYEWANASFLCNASTTDGYYYLLYAGSDELSQFGGWGHAEIGIARSRNLVDWQVPPG